MSSTIDVAFLRRIRCRRINADTFVVRVPSGFRTSSLAGVRAFLDAIDSFGTIAGVASSLASRECYVRVVR